MGFGRIGGMLVVGGCVLFMIAVAIAMGGGGVGIGLRDAGGLVLAASLVLVGSGAAVLSVAGPWPLHGRVVRVGLGTLSVGLVSLLASSIMVVASTVGSEESLPMLVLVFVGLVASVVGAVVIVLGGTGVGVLAINGSRSAPVASL